MGKSWQCQSPGALLLASKKRALVALRQKVSVWLTNAAVAARADFAEMADL